MQTALYHQENKAPKPLFVVAKNEDGTVDLATEANGAPVITSCKVTGSPVNGSCTIEAGKPAAKEAAAPANANTSKKKSK